MDWYRLITAAYTNELGHLRNYLQEGVNPYDFSHYLDEYFEENGGFPKGYVEGDQYIEKMSSQELDRFKQWLDESGKLAEATSDAQSPSYLFLDYQDTLSNSTWLVHFTDEPRSIATEGFRGHEDMFNLGLTTYFKKRGKEKGWNFAFVVGSRDANNAESDGKYGKHAILFQSTGVKAYHNGDEENQVLFWGPSVREVVPLYKHDGAWSVSSTRDERILRQGDFADVVEWAVENYAQYRNVIAHFNA